MTAFHECGTKRKPGRFTEFLSDLSDLNDVHSMSSNSSGDRVPTQCSGGHEFDSCWGPRFFLSYMCHVDQFTYLSPIFMSQLVLISVSVRQNPT